MKQTTIQILDQLFQEDPILRSDPVSQDEIQRAEEEIGIPFSNEYKKFVELYGGAIVGSLPIIGLRKAEPMGKEESSVIQATKWFRDEGWAGVCDLAVISVDLAGNPYGLDKNGEIWVSDHDAGEVVKVADSFENFLLKFCLVS